MPPDLLQRLSPLLLHGGLGLLQRGDPFANLQRGLLIGGQIASQEERARREKEEREQQRKVMEQLAKAYGLPESAAKPPAPGAPGTLLPFDYGVSQPAPAPRPLGPTPLGTPPQLGGAPEGVRPEDMSLGMTQALETPRTLLDEAIDPATGRLREDITDEDLLRIAPRLPQAPVPPTLFPVAGQAAPPRQMPGYLPASGAQATPAMMQVPQGPPAPGLAPPARPSGIEAMARSLISTQQPQLVQQGLQMLAQQGVRQEQQGFRQQQSSLDRQLRRQESARQRALTREQKALDRQLRRELAAEASAMKLQLSAEKAARPKEATDTVRRALAGGETMLSNLDLIEGQIARGFDPSAFWGQLREAGGSITTSDERLRFNAVYNRTIEGLVQSAAGVASDQDIERMMTLYRPRLGDSQDTMRTKYLGLLSDARSIFSRVAGRTAPDRQNEEQRVASQIVTNLNERIQRIQSVPGYEGFNPRAEQMSPRVGAPAQGAPPSGFSELSLQQLDQMLMDL